MMPPLWALLVAIDEYPRSDWLPAAGALTDSQNVSEYLIGEMNIPEDHILQLHNDAATRSAIVAAFQEHLVENSRISKGDAILFYFAGHGSYVKAPTDLAISGTEGTVEHIVEVILPYDGGSTGAETDSPICVISEQTLAALLDTVAARHGNNITVVLDCGSSQLGPSAKNATLFRKEVLTSRTIDFQHLARLSLNLDHDLVHPLSTTPRPVVHGNTRRGRFQAIGPDYALLIACRPNEQAQGIAGFGGIFTTLWLRAMRSDLRPRTYAQVIRYITGEFSRLCEAEGVRWDQHPQCEGIVRDRIVFEETMVKTDHFDAKPSADSGEFDVEVGEIHGVEEKTGFVLYGLDQFSREEQLGTAVAIRVNKRTCTIRADWQVQSPTDYSAYTATITQTPALNYTVSVYPTTSPADANSTLGKLSTALSKAQGIMKVTDTDEADLEVRVDVQGAITLHRQDVLMRNLPNPIPRIAGKYLNPKNLNTVFCGIAQFNFHLYLANSKHPFADKVTFDMLRFTRPMPNLVGDSGVLPLPKVDGHAPTTDGNKEFEVTDKDDYAMVLTNNTDVDLYVQAWYFDPDIYSVDVLYEPVSGAPPSLPGKGGTLQIGVSQELPWPLTFFVPDGGESSTLFAKIFLTDRPVKLRAMEQPAIIGSDAVNDGNLQQGEIETKGVWDTLLQPITVVRA